MYNYDGSNLAELYVTAICVCVSECVDIKIHSLADDTLQSPSRHRFMTAKQNRTCKRLSLRTLP